MRLLCLDGGGCRGIIQARVLAKLEEMTGRPTSELFDLVVGSSVGGILALCLTKPNPMTAAALVRFLYQYGPTIFDTSTANLTSLGSLLGPKYGATNLADILHDHLNLPLSEHHPVAVTSYDALYAMPAAIKSWGAHGDFALASEAALATSAAPTYFPAYQNRWVDGGCVANNPSLVALMCAHELLDVHEPIELLSLGTGIPQQPGFTVGAWGRLEWMTRITDVMCDGSAAVAHMVAPSFCSRYLRVQPTLPANATAMDDPKLMALWDALGAKAFDRKRADLESFFNAPAEIASDKLATRDARLEHHADLPAAPAPLSKR